MKEEKKLRKFFLAVMDCSGTIKAKEGNALSLFTIENRNTKRNGKRCLIHLFLIKGHFSSHLDFVVQKIVVESENIRISINVKQNLRQRSAVVCSFT